MDRTQAAATRAGDTRVLVLSHRLRSARVTVALAATTVAAVAVLWVADHFLIEPGTPTVDLRGLELASSQRTAATVAVARIVTHLGDLWLVALIAGVLVALARRRSGRWDSAKLVTVAVGGTAVIAGVAKELTERIRPEDAITSTVSLAFPSGHAARGAVVYLLIAWLAFHWSHRPAVRFGVGALAVAMVVATSWSRVLLGAHWPSDVLAGAALGTLWLAVVVLATRPVTVVLTRPRPPARDEVHP